MSDYEINTQVAEQIQEHRTYRGQSFREGAWAALLDGQVVGVEDTLDAVMELLKDIEPDPDRGMVAKVAKPVMEFIRCL